MSELRKFTFVCLCFGGLCTVACRENDGASATITTLTPGGSHCPAAGGVEIQVGAGAPTYICNGAAGMNGTNGSSDDAGVPGTCTNALAYGADPTGATDTSGAINAALAATAPTSGSVCLPCGTYHVTHAINLGTRDADAGQAVTASRTQSLTGQNGCTIIDVGTDFDPSALGVVIVDGVDHETTTVAPSLQDLHFVFHQPTDIVTTATAAAPPGAATLQVSSTAGIAVHDYVVDATQGAVTLTPAIVQWDNTTSRMNLTTVTAVDDSTNTVTLSNPVVPNNKDAGVAMGDTIDFSPPRSTFTSLPGCDTKAGSPGCKYPWAVYGSGMDEAHFDNLLIEGAWDGLYLHGGTVGGASAFSVGDVQVGALNVGLDIDDIHNFPTINSFMGYAFGGVLSGPAFGENYYDGDVTCANLGATDGITIDSLQCWTGAVNLTASWSWGTINSLMLDGTSAHLTCASMTHENRTKIGEMYITGGTIPSTYNPILVTNGTLEIGDLSLVHGGNGAGIEVTGGLLAILGGNMVDYIPPPSPGDSPSVYFASVSGVPEGDSGVTPGELDVYNTDFGAQNLGSGSLYFRQTGDAGVLKMVNDRFTVPGGGLVGVKIDSDNAGNLVQNVEFNGWTFASGATVSSPVGVYTPDGALSARRITGGKADSELLSDLVIAWDSTDLVPKTQTIYGCSSTNAGESLTIADEHGDVATNTITVTPQSGTIDSSSDQVISTPHGSLNIVCDGAGNWYSVL